MRFTYEDQGSSTFVVYHVAETEEIDTMSLGMLTNNCIPGYAPASFYQKNADKYIKFNVTGKVAVASMFQGPVNKKRLTGLLQGIVDAMIAAEEYMLDPDSVELNLENIYMDPVTCETVVLCVPVFRENHVPVDLPMFLKNLVFNTQFDQTENTDHVAKIFNCLGAGSKLVLEDLKALLDQIQGNHAPVPISGKTGGQPVVTQTEEKKKHPDSGGTVDKGIPATPDSGSKIENGDIKGGGTTPSKDTSSFPIPNGGQVPTPKPDPKTGENKSSWNLFSNWGKKKKDANQESAGKDAKQTKKKKESGPVKRQPQSGGSAESKQPVINIPGQEPDSAKKQISAAQDLPPVDKTEPSSQQGKKAISFGGTTVLGKDPNATVQLQKEDYPELFPTLVRKNTGERVQIRKQTFTIGIENYVDYRITGNSAVSRSHAKIIIRGHEYFLVDTNSTNGTYVNGQKLKSNVEYRIDSGCKVIFANEMFDFLIC